MIRDEKQYLVIGCGRFGTAVATSLESLGYRVMVVDSNEDSIQNISEKVTHAAILDVTEEGSLAKIGIGNFDVVIIAIGSNFKASVLSCLIAKEKGVGEVICKAADEIQSRVLQKIGADRIVMPEKDMGRRLVQNLVSHNVLDQIELGDEHTIYEIRVPKSWVGKSLLQLDLRKRSNLSVVAIKRNENIILNIDPEENLIENDIIVIAGETGVIKHFCEK